MFFLLSLSPILPSIKSSFLTSLFVEQRPDRAGDLNRFETFHMFRVAYLTPLLLWAVNPKVE